MRFLWTLLKDVLRHQRFLFWSRPAFAANNEEPKHTFPKELSYPDGF